MASSEDESTPWGDVTLRDLLTTVRLGSYLDAADGDLPRALRLYDWNVEASAAALATVGMVALDRRGCDDVAKARHRATRGGRNPESHGKVVAELSFGFWRYLTAQRYHAALWVPALHRAFPAGCADLRERRRYVERSLATLMSLRNRAAHHEPVHRRDLLADVRIAVELMSWVHPDASAWLGARTALPRVLGTRPTL